MITYKKLIIIFAAFFYITLVYSQKNLTLQGYLPYAGVGTNDIWGYVDTANNEYALVCLHTGISIVNVTVPSAPVEKFFIPGTFSIWGDIKTWKKYAYAINETSGGLHIIDLSGLPDTVTDFFWNDTIGLSKAHNIFIDENGYAYIIGSNIGAGGVVILDLATPANPVYVGIYNVAYVHDAFVRGDTLWTAEINAGQFAVIDVSNKANPTLIGMQTVPGAFVHSTWVSDDGITLFTADEKGAGYYIAYDVSDLSNIKELDRYRTTKDNNVIPHNIFFLNNYLINSYYTEGVTIVDATKPDNLVEIGYYDTSPFSGYGFFGAWGVYPYLPSGNILVSDMEEGLFVLSPNYTRACYLEGAIVDTAGSFINNIKVEFIGYPFIEYTDLLGKYKTGVPDSGYYDIRFSSSLCQTKLIPNILLQPGVTTILNDTLVCSPVGIFDIANQHNNIKLYVAVSSLNNITDIYYDLNEQPESNSQLSIFDIYGRVIEQLPLTASSGIIHYDQLLSAGIYFIRITHNNISKNVKFARY